MTSRPSRERRGTLPGRRTRERGAARERRSSGAAIGLRVRSGWAAAVLLTGPADSPRVLDHRVLDLCDPEAPESRQPHHAGFGRLEQDASEIARRSRIVRTATRRSVARLLADHRGGEGEILRAALVVGSLADPATLSNPHIRAHALEGELFRAALADALAAAGVPCSVARERDLYPQAARKLGRWEDELRQAVAGLGRSRKPWRADEKLAALAAWLLLAAPGR